ncbi:keratin-associated protein 10-6-like [Portunus trituberculatus]|uniref:keratin-associated protein 10-6-like n=1 Tax=Portunus trituberculatus TaxID=210409 RepID=UPI001E1CB249|nr:keratin-associated protein 10-6-like [Portunus trituberculatus]
MYLNRIMVRRSSLVVAVALVVAVMFVRANTYAHGSARYHLSECYLTPDLYCTLPSFCNVTVPDISCSIGWTCCTECDTANCSGTCRAKGGCLEDEFTVTECGKYCDCCNTCQDDNCTGQCVGSPYFCTGGNYIDGTCAGGNCSCCVPCGSPDAQCAEAGGVCVGAGNECPCGSLPHPDFGCTSGDCICCVACYPLLGCIGGHNPGRCVANVTMCDMTKEYISSDECSSIDGSCSCCKTCTPDQICASEGGMCVSKSGNCATGYRESILGGGCCADECKCCVPDPCSNADSTCTADAYGTVCTSRNRCRNKRLQYMSNDTCESSREMCCKACIPDTTCSSQGGHCINADERCTGDLIESTTGSCCDSQFCKCCIPDPTKTCWNATCLTNPNPVVFGSNCRDIGDYKFDSDCRTKCCKKCKPDAQCCSEGGRCYIDNCPVDLQQSQTGTCNDDANCKCCV